MTAARDVDTVRNAVGLGVAQYLVKPFPFATLPREARALHGVPRQGATSGGEAEQDEIDAMLGELRSSSALPLPKGLSKETLDLVAHDAPGAQSAVGAAEVADAAGRSPGDRPTLSRAPRVEAKTVELELRYGGGRPEHRYRWSGL